MMKKILYILLILSIIPFAVPSTYLDYVTCSSLSSGLCPSASFTYLEVENTTVTNYNITDELYSYGNVYFYNYLDCERLTTVNGLLVCDDMGEYLINGTDKTVHFGKVGIGTSTPTSELHVIGGINATGNIYGNDVCETSIGSYCLSDLADYSLTSTIQTWFSDNRSYSDLTYQRKDDTATNLSNYWKSDGSSTATGNWNISPYTIESPIVYTNQTCYTPDCSSRIYYNGTGMIIEG